MFDIKQVMRTVAVLIFINYPTLLQGNNITIVTILSAADIHPFSVNRVGAAIDMGLEKLETTLPADFNVMHIRQTFPGLACKNNVAATTSDVYNKHNVSVFIGPESNAKRILSWTNGACSDAVDIVGRMAASWNIPLLSPLATSITLDDKDDFNTLTRLYFKMNSWAQLFIAVFNHYKWTDIGIIHDINSSMKFQIMSTDLESALISEGKRAHRLHFDSSRTFDMKQILLQTRARSRVFIISMYDDDLRRTMLLAQSLGMTNEEYVYLCILESGKERRPWFRNDSLDSSAKKAYESVLFLKVREPDSTEFYAFEEEFKMRSLRDYSFDYGDTAIDSSATAYYDAFLVYADALNDMRAKGENYMDGRLMSSKIWGKQFTGVSGLVSIDAQGDRQLNYSLLDMNPSTGGTEVVANFFGHKNALEFEGSIHWPNNKRPPLNEPRCGFLGNAEVCKETGLSFGAWAAIIFAILTPFSVLVIFAIYRKFKDEVGLLSKWWMIDWKDILTLSQCSVGGMQSNSLHSSQLGASIHDDFLTQNFGQYKGMPVVAKSLRMRSVKLNRKCLLELVEMRDIPCCNLTRFYGLCLDSDHLSVVWEHCTRGTLRDMLQNDAVKLLDEIKLALMNDIIKGDIGWLPSNYRRWLCIIRYQNSLLLFDDNRPSKQVFIRAYKNNSESNWCCELREGMCFLHGTSIMTHGSLNSSNCLIDGRFVLKIADFGLPTIKCQERILENINKHPLLYVAPEHLDNPYTNATQAGDAYSFGIVLYELLTRMEPYENELEMQSVEDTLRMIQDPVTSIRPTCELFDAIGNQLKILMAECWTICPEKRPTFSTIRRRTRTLFPYLNSKYVLDLILRRMEQYANNLETLVGERTQALLIEKRKSEELLYKMLPRSVADKLMNGKMVEPTAFETVTICFTDIVGFTSKCARSTPLQVVNLLNDLYSCFDSIIETFDVYKVETIGDAYMVVSGLPVRNGNEHVRQIARTALALLEGITYFRIRHLPTEHVEARFGVHTGPVCSGVVGKKMPRYCLFGDTVNTANRLESTGQAMKIQISEATLSCLSAFGTFVVEERGYVELKGKGVLKTYWLINENENLSDIEV